MDRICSTLQDAGYMVTLIGRQKQNSLPLPEKNYRQTRLRCLWQSGPLFYLEFTVRAFLWLSIRKKGIIWSVDTDTILAAGLLKALRRMQIVWDAHEYFTEVPELEGRALVKKTWSVIERIFVPQCQAHITVSPGLAAIFENKFGIPFQVVPNVPVLKNRKSEAVEKKGFTLYYQGMLNQGRGLEQAIAAMVFLPDIQLMIAGEGDLSEQLRQLASYSPASDRITFTGWVTGDTLQILAQEVSLGLNLLDGSALSYRYSLANKFFDYMHSGLPSLNMSFPEYQTILRTYPVGLCIDDLTPESIAAAVEYVRKNPLLLSEMQDACSQGAKEYNWQRQVPAILHIVHRLS